VHLGIQHRSQLVVRDLRDGVLGQLLVLAEDGQSVLQKRPRELNRHVCIILCSCCAIFVTPCIALADRRPTRSSVSRYSRSESARMRRSSACSIPWFCMHSLTPIPGAWSSSGSVFLRCLRRWGLA